MKFILASSSKNRQALLERMGIAFEAIAPDYEEQIQEDLSTIEMVETFSLGKAKSVYHQMIKSPAPNKDHKNHALESDLFVLGCDSMISIEGRSIGKAYSEAEAIEQLLFFRGKRQEVITGLALVGHYQGQYFEVVEHEVSPLDFRADVDEALIRKYLKFGDWQGKCGSYSILGTGVFFLDGILGDFQNIVGLPILRMGRMMEKVTGKHPLELLESKSV
ncbi:MAG TPA: Maf family protein [Candidatus Gracilibacteria bacterium]